MSSQSPQIAPSFKVEYAASAVSRCSDDVQSFSSPANDASYTTFVARWDIFFELFAL